MSSRPSSFQLTGEGPVRLYRTRELITLPPPVWLIEDIMPLGGVVGLYGEPGAGKSFVAIDMALSVAAGLDWQGHPTRTGYGLYVSAEGGTGIGKRVKAWMSAHDRTAAQCDNIAWLIESIPVYEDSEGIGRLIDRIRDEVERIPALVVIDTLARCFDGDENQQQDMGRFIKGVDVLRREWDCTVLIVHHTRLGGDRERGNTAFRGAADTMMSVTPATGPGARPSASRALRLSCNKQKEAVEFPDRCFHLQSVPETDSCVLMGQTTEEAAVPLRRDPAEKIGNLLAYLMDHGPLTAAEWQAANGTAKSTFWRLVGQMEENGQIAQQNGRFRCLA